MGIGESLNPGHHVMGLGLLIQRRLFGCPAGPDRGSKRGSLASGWEDEDGR